GKKMDSGTLFLYIGFGLGGALLIVLIFLFFISRRSQKTMQSLLTIMTAPERAQIADASRVLETIMSNELEKITMCFQTIHENLRGQIATADALKEELTVKNTALVELANNATQRVAQMSDRIDNTVSGLNAIVNSESWQSAQNATDNFATTVENVLKQVAETTSDSTNKIAQIEQTINQWNSDSKTLSEDLQRAFDTNSEQFKKITSESQVMCDSISELGKSTLEGFTNLKNVSSNYEDVMNNNSKTLDDYLTKLDTFGKQSKKQLTAQMNILTTTANVVGGQALLAESSIESQIKKLTEAVETLMASATETETAVRNISNELSGLTNHFDNEIKDFATDVVSELKTVSGVANTTLNDTKTAANVFSESVKNMATGVRETLLEMNTAHTQLSGQSAELIKMSTETTAKLKPLSELIEQYYSALPDLARTSDDAGQTLGQIVTTLDDKIANIKTTVEQSTESLRESAAHLSDLAGQSRQQMIDLMADYAKAVDTMQTLNKQMMIARATAPMEAIKTTGGEAFPAPRASSRDFLIQSERDFDKMYEQTLDLTRTMGAQIPDVVWKKYHDGDKTIFAKWMAKMLKAADKKQIHELIKTDSVFRSQATQFVRSFEKILSAAKQTDSPDKLIAALVKTDLGQVYSTISAQI
nr:hypothetical protein [Alphaproteobacteria bacterium]